MIPFSHYDDGHVGWGMTPEEQAGCTKRLRRLGSIPQYICGEYNLPENHTDEKILERVRADRLTTFEAAKQKLRLVPMIDREGTRKFVTTNYPQGHYTFAALSYVNHTSDYLLRDIPERQQVRDWAQKVLREALGHEPTRPRRATYGGKLNRTSLKHCVTMMQRLLPAMLLVWIDHGADEDWGPMCYPPMGTLPKPPSEDNNRAKEPKVVRHAHPNPPPPHHPYSPRRRRRRIDPCPPVAAAETLGLFAQGIHGQGIGSRLGRQRKDGQTRLGLLEASWVRRSGNGGEVRSKVMADSPPVRIHGTERPQGQRSMP